jgi:hypothetical protein
MIAVAELEKARLGSRGAFGATGHQGVQAVFNFSQIKRQIIVPQARTFADRRGLCRLHVSVAQAGQISMVLGEIRQSSDDLNKSPPDQFHGIPQENQVRVVGDETTGRAQVNDCFGRRAGIPVGVDVRHDVMSQGAFVFRGLGEVDVVHILAQFFDLGVGNRESDLLFGFRQRHPQPTPSAELALTTPQVTHFTGGVSADERILVLIVGHGLDWIEDLSVAVRRTDASRRSMATIRLPTNLRSVPVAKTWLIGKEKPVSNFLID